PRRESLDSPLGPPDGADHFVGAAGKLGELLGAEPDHPLFEPLDGLLDPLDGNLDSLCKSVIEYLHSVLGELARVDTDVPALTDGLGEVSRGSSRRLQLLADLLCPRVCGQVRPG